MELTFLGILAVALLGIIIYFFFKLRSTLKNAPGAEAKMNTSELIKNWQENKQKESEYINELKEKAREQAKPEIEKKLIDQYKQDMIKEATQSKADEFSEKLGVNSKDFFSKDKVEAMIGKRNVDIDTGINSAEVITRDRVKEMTGHGVNNDRLRDAAHSSINYESGVRRGISNTNRVDIDRILNKRN